MKLDPYGTFALGMMIISAFVMALVLYAIWINMLSGAPVP